MSSRSRETGILNDIIIVITLVLDLFIFTRITISNLITWLVLRSMRFLLVMKSSGSSLSMGSSSNYMSSRSREASILNDIIIVISLML